MTPKKKVALFIVEGFNDQIALAMPLEKLLTSESVKFEFTGGDFTSDYSGKDIAAKIGDCIKKHCAEYKYTKEDFLEVVLLVDMDGAYINDDFILHSDDHNTPYYNSCSILCISPEKLKKTHIHKQRNLNRLTSLPAVWSIPFSVYFFSCNLDHVICGDANLSQVEKSKVARRFEANYTANPAGFLAFFRSDDIFVNSSYSESWDFIKKNNNSLSRCSNLSVFLSPMAPRVQRAFPNESK